MNFLLESLTARIKEQVKNQLPQILPKEVSNFAPPVIKNLIKESRDKVTLAKVSSQPQSSYEAASTLTEFELKKILLNKMEKSNVAEKTRIKMKTLPLDQTRGFNEEKLRKDVDKKGEKERFSRGEWGETLSYGPKKKIFNLELKVIKRISTLLSLILQDQISKKASVHSIQRPSRIRLCRRPHREQVDASPTNVQFSDGVNLDSCLSLEDITRISSFDVLVEVKMEQFGIERALFMIKDINKLLKEGRRKDG
ncbi:hypothetical protein Tco_1191469 [Tanacetum coccineum]